MARSGFSQEVPTGDRMGREQLVVAAAGYYAAVNAGHPDLAPLDAEGARVEVGTQITGNPDFTFDFYEAVDGSALPNFGLWSAQEQFQRGLWNADGVANERYPIADPVTGVVIAFTLYRPWHKRAETDVAGVGLIRPRDRTGRRVCLNMMEAFKIKGGRIGDMESVWTIEPADFQSAWQD